MLSAAVVLWRLGADDFADESVYLSAPAAEMARAQRVRKERTATVVVAGLLLALAAVTVVRAALTLANEEQPEETWSGVVRERQKSPQSSHSLHLCPAIFVPLPSACKPWRTVSTSDGCQACDN